MFTKKNEPVDKKVKTDKVFDADQSGKSKDNDKKTRKPLMEG